MSECPGNLNCVQKRLKRILEAQKKAEREEKGHTECNCIILESLQCKPNTIPFILYSDSGPFEATGVFPCFDRETQKLKFICFSTFIFKIIEIENNCAVLELLKFKCADDCGSDEFCTPCCQLDWENVEDLVSTCSSIEVDLSCFCGITCLPPVAL